MGKCAWRWRSRRQLRPRAEPPRPQRPATSADRRHRRERDDRATDAAHEGMGYRTEQGATLVLRRSAQGEPSEYLRFADQPLHCPLQDWRQVGQGPGRGQFVVQTPDQFVFGKHTAQGLRPRAIAQRLTRQGLVHRPHLASVRVFVLDRLNAAIQQFRWVAIRSGRQTALR